MKVLITSMAVILSVAVCTAAAFGAGEDKKKGGEGGGNMMPGQSMSGQNKLPGEGSQNSGNDNKNSAGNPNSGSPNKQTITPDNRGTANRGTANRGTSNRNDNKMGDSNWDKNGIGSMDESKHRDDKDTKWRYQHMGNNWWYWMPGGYWSYWRYGHWNRYNVDTYVDVGMAPSTGGDLGPYYQDETGFYHLEGNRKVYDPNIHRDPGPPPAG